MLCPKCGADNRESAKFCDGCGAPLLAHCPSCGIVARAGARFCDSCGAALLAVAPVTGANASLASTGGERRHLTVLFSDLVNSTAIASQLDPEEWREIVASYHRAAANAITQFGGYVAQYLGDGVMAYFGWPEAHDNDAERAALAGLAILENLPALNEDPRRPRLSARVGIDSGTVVVGTGVGHSVEIFGDTPNIAARVQTAAEPGVLLVTDGVLRLISGMFTVEDRGPQTVKGIRRPLNLYRVVQPSGVRDRLSAVAATRGLTRFVGREEELRACLTRWDRVTEGEGQTILIVGEPGMGKSRLVQRFHEQIEGTPHTWLDCAAGALHQNTPFYAVMDMLRQGIPLRGDLNSEQQLGNLEKSLEITGLKPSDAVPLIAPLLNLAVPDKYPALTVPPEQQRRRLLAALVQWVLGTARIRPLVIVFEDLHWADPSTLEAIQLLAEQSPTVPLLLIFTARPEFRAPWPLSAQHVQLMLNRLSPHSVREIVAQLADRARPLPTMIETVVERCGGVPLFVEELTRSVLESGGNAIASEIPATLHDSLTARLDRLGDAREIAQVASVIGNEFSWELLSAITKIDGEKLQAALRKLGNSEMVFVQGMPPEANYRFKHALIRDAAYQSLLRSKRQECHRKIAETLERGVVAVNTRPELLAYHCTEGDLKEQGISYWQAAAHQAAQRSANAEAISHLTNALTILKSFPETASRAQRELALQVALAVPLMLTKGYAALEVEQVYSRARELWQQVGDSPQFFPMLFGLWAFYSVKADYRTACELGEQLVRLAENAQDPALLVEAHAARGNTLSFLGQLELAREHLERAITLYDPQQHGSHAFVYGQDPGVHALSYETLTLWLLGYPDQARKRSQEAFALARQLSHPYSSAFALVHVLYIHRFSRQLKPTEDRANELVALSSEHGFPITLAVGAVHRGWALSEQGLGEEGIRHIRQGIDTWHATGSTLFFQPFLLSMLAEALWKVGTPEQGLAALAEAQSIVNQTGECFWEAELYRLKGELTLQSSVPRPSVKIQDKAEECFHTAIDISRRQSAKSLELRAVTSLSRLLLQQARSAEAGDKLAGIFGWFTEGFDTADLKEALALSKSVS
jgi:predicted ATPase/class 3 adenylate cyclase